MGNACGTIGLLHAVGNATSKIKLCKSALRIEMLWEIPFSILCKLKMVVTKLHSILSPVPACQTFG